MYVYTARICIYLRTQYSPYTKHRPIQWMPTESTGDPRIKRPMQTFGYMGVCQNDGPFWGPINTRCRIILKPKDGRLFGHPPIYEPQNLCKAHGEPPLPHACNVTHLCSVRPPFKRIDKPELPKSLIRTPLFLEGPSNQNEKPGLDPCFEPWFVSLATTA